MRVLQITTDNREHDKRYEVPQPYFGQAPSALFSAFAKRRDIHVHVLSFSQRRLPAPALISEGLPFTEIFIPRLFYGRSLYIGCILATRRFVRKHRFDLVHGQGTERECAISALLSGVPSVVTIHGNMRVQARLKRARVASYNGVAAALERVVVPSADAIVCVSRYTQALVRKEAKLAELIYNPVDSYYIDAAPRVANGVQAGKILCVAHITERKNQVNTVRALAQVVEARGWVVAFAGRGTESDEYFRSFRSAIGQRPCFQFLGCLTKEQLAAELRTSKCLLLNSIEDNCPTVILEALASGVPVVAAGVGGIPEIVEHGVNGFVHTPGDDAAMVRHLLQVMQPSLNAEMSVKARQAAESRYAPAVIADQHVTLYKRLLENENK